jgi:hypothetical protein
VSGNPEASTSGPAVPSVGVEGAALPQPIASAIIANTRDFLLCFGRMMDLLADVTEAPAR